MTDDVFTFSNRATALASGSDKPRRALPGRTVVEYFERGVVFYGLDDFDMTSPSACKWLVPGAAEAERGRA